MRAEEEDVDDVNDGVFFLFVAGLVTFLRGETDAAPAGMMRPEFGVRVLGEDHWQEIGRAHV